MKINVTAMPREGAKCVYTNQTAWPAGPPIAIEVVAADDDPPHPLRTAKTPGVLAHDGMQIGRLHLAKLRATPGVTVSGADQTNAIEVTAQMAEASAAHRLEVEGLKATIAELSGEVARLKPFEGQRAEQEATIADLRSRLGKQSQKPQQQPQAR